MRKYDVLQEQQEQEQEQQQQQQQQQQPPEAQKCDKNATKRCVTSCGMTRTSYCALHLRARAVLMNNTKAHTTLHNPYGIESVRSSTIRYIYIPEYPLCPMISRYIPIYPRTSRYIPFTSNLHPSMYIYIYI